MMNLNSHDQRILNAAENAYACNYSGANSVAAATLRALVREYAFKDLGTMALLSADDILKLADTLDRCYD